MRRLLRVGAALVLLWTVAPAWLEGQTEFHDIRRLRATLPSTTVNQILEIVRGAERDGIPAERLYLKALEGIGKGHPADDVLRAVRQHAAGLREARRVVGPEIGDNQLEDAASALREGVDESVIRALAHDYQQDFSILLFLLEDLTEQRVTVEDALELIDVAEENGYQGHRLLSISDAVRIRIRAGGTPAQAALGVRDDLHEGRPLVPDDH